MDGVAPLAGAWIETHCHVLGETVIPYAAAKLRITAFPQCKV
jgi:hypothetical protein